MVRSILFLRYLRFALPSFIFNRFHVAGDGSNIAPNTHIFYPAVQEPHLVTSRQVQTGTLIHTVPSPRHSLIGHADVDNYMFTLFIMRSKTISSLIYVSAINVRWASLDLLRGGLLTLWTLVQHCRVVRLDMSVRDEIEKVGHLLFVLRDTWPENLVLSLLSGYVADLDRVLNFPSRQMLDLVVYAASKIDLDSVLKLLVCLREYTVSQIYVSRLRCITISVQTLYVLSKARAYHCSLRRRNY